MAGPDVIGRIQRLFIEALNAEAPSVDADLIESGLLDSLALVELLFALEREFGVAIALEELDIDTFRSVRRIGAFVDGLRVAD
jgi:acyl carrier protein